MLLQLHLSAQNSTAIWYFGDKAGLDFSTSPPTVLTNSVMWTKESSAVMCDPITGQLMMYTNGVTIWDKTHTPMPGSVNTPLIGHPSTTMGALIIPQPGSDHLFYVFTAGAQAGFFQFNRPELGYSIIDMNLRNGLGDLVSINNILIDSTTEKLTAIGSCDHSTYWILAHRWNSDTFYAYKLTSNGLSAPVKSKAGSFHQSFGGLFNSETMGTMRFSPDGKKIGLVNAQNMHTIEFFDFDVKSGHVSNAVIEQLGPQANSQSLLYGSCFSPDGSKFYVSWLSDTSRIYQYDMNAGNGAAILASKTVIAERLGVAFGALQLAKDGRIYGKSTVPFSMDAILYPNEKGNLCGFAAGFLYAGINYIDLGLPNFVVSEISGEGFSTQFQAPSSHSICVGDTLIAPQEGIQINQIQPSQFAHVNLSGEIIFYPKQTTTFSIRYSNSCGHLDTAQFTVHVIPFPNSDFTISPSSITLGDEWIFCQPQDRDELDYAWYDKGNLVSTDIEFDWKNPGLGKHCLTLQVTNEQGCAGTTTQCITVQDTIQSDLFIPNAFSPNQDGLNDVFIVKGRNIQLVEFVIYNRYGQRVFTTPTMDVGWDGRHQGTCCEMGVYYYLITYVDAKNKQVMDKGDISLIR